METPQSTSALETSELVAVHSLTWLAVGNAVGLVLATLLLAPELGELLGPFSYGRLMPLHLDLQLYGWSSLPLVGVLLHLFLRDDASRRLGRLAVALWSGALAFGAVSWLAGDVGGKLFLDWKGPARTIFAASLAVLTAVLLVGFVRRSGDGAARLGRGLFLAALVAVPAVLYFAASPEVYPPINPDSGGATGSSLLGSTLGIVVIIYLAPFFLGLKADDGGRIARRLLPILGLHFLWFGLLDHGDRSHHEILQIVSLSSLAIWPPLLVRHLRRFPWPAAARPWLVAFAGWAVFLVLTGVVDFLPGVLERLKFTNALVAHAHVAMAGMVTCLNVVLLQTLLRHGPLRRLFADRGSFILWHGGSLLLVVALLVLGTIEGTSPGILFRPSPAVELLYLLRLVGGAAMALASWRWLAGALALRRRSEAGSPRTHLETSAAVA